MFIPLSQFPLRMYRMTEFSSNRVLTPSTATIAYRIRMLNSALIRNRSFCSGLFSRQGMPALPQRAEAFTVETRCPEGRMMLKMAESRPRCSSESLMVA